LGLFIHPRCSGLHGMSNGRETRAFRALTNTTECRSASLEKNPRQESGKYLGAEIRGRDPTRKRTIRSRPREFLAPMAAKHHRRGHPKQFGWCSATLSGAEIPGWEKAVDLGQRGVPNDALETARLHRHTGRGPCRNRRFPRRNKSSLARLWPIQATIRDGQANLDYFRAHEPGSEPAVVKSE